MFPRPRQRGLYLDSRICKSPSDHLFCCTRDSTNVLGAIPKKLFFVGLKYTDFHPRHWIAKPVITSSTGHPYFRPICKSNINREAHRVFKCWVYSYFFDFSKLISLFEFEACICLLCLYVLGNCSESCTAVFTKLLLC